MIPRFLPDQIAHLYHEIAEIKRRERNRKRKGKIAEVGTGENAGKYRVELSKQNDKPYLTDWIKSRNVGAGIVKLDVVRKVGEQVDVLSESGDMTDAEIDLSSYSDENDRENTDNIPLHLKIDGDAVIICANVRIDANVTINGNFAAKGGTFTHNDTNVGDDHKHDKVVTGSDNTGNPV